MDRLDANMIKAALPAAVADKLESLPDKPAKPMTTIEKYEALQAEGRRAEAKGRSRVVSLAKSTGTATQEDEIEVKPWPILPENALFGLAGEVVKLATRHSEADPAAVLLTFLTAFGAAAGRSRYLRVGDAVHHARLFVALVGNSSRARKGTSATPVKRLLQAAEAHLHAGPTAVPGGLPLKISDGPLSSGEGMVWRIRDPSGADKDGRPTDPGVEDKRLLIIEGEFGGALRIAKRDGSSLSSTLRSAWDGGTIAPLVSGRSKAVVSASDPHFCLVAHVTQAELREVLSGVDLFNGVAESVSLGLCATRTGDAIP